MYARVDGEFERCLFAPGTRPRSSSTFSTAFLPSTCRNSKPNPATHGGDAPVIRLVNLVLMSAIQKGASDVHFEPYEKEFRVRFRIDGILHGVMSPPMKFKDAIASRLKIMARLDIAERRLPQDGRIKLRFVEHGTLEGNRLPRLLPADAVRRKDRAAAARPRRR